MTEVDIDDVAIRKGQTYTTAVYDRKNGRHLLALPEGRNETEFRKWLLERLKIERVACNHAGVYSKAISEILPDVV